MTKKRFFSALLSVCMVISMIPTPAYASVSLTPEQIAELTLGTGGSSSTTPQAAAPTQPDASTKPDAPTQPAASTQPDASTQPAAPTQPDASTTPDATTQQDGLAAAPATAASPRAVTLPDGVTDAFQLNLDIKMPNGSTSPQPFTFGIHAENPKGLTLISYDGINDGSVAGAVTFPEKITNPNSGTEYDFIGFYLYGASENKIFTNCKAITEVTIPKSVKYLDQAFYGCKSLEKAIFAEGSTVTEITEIFRDCVKLKEVNIPESVTKMNNAFVGCTALEKITIPKNVSDLDQAFTGCTSLAEINFAPGYTAKFDSYTQLNSAFSQTAIKSFTFPDGATSGDNFALRVTFDSCENLESIDFNKLKPVELYGTFTYCRSLKSLTIPDSVKKLDTIDMRKVSSGYSPALEEIIFTSAQPPELTDVLLPDKTVVIVPASAVESYKANSSFTGLVSRIYPDDELLFVDSENYDINELVYCKDITDIDLTGAVKGPTVTAPLKFTATGLPAGITLSEDGVISGAPTSETSAAGTAVITVADSSSPVKTASIEISYPAVTFDFSVGSLFNYKLNVGATPEDFQFEITAEPTATANGKIALKQYKGKLDTTGALNIPETITLGGKAFEITELLSYIFMESEFTGSNSITSVTIPKTVEKLDRAFAKAEKLESVTFAEGFKANRLVHSFAESGLKSVIIPSSVTTLTGTFEGTKLTSVTIPANASYLSSAFRRCTLLTEVKFAQGFQGKSFESAFEGCTALETIKLPESATSLKKAFALCTALKTIELPESTTSLTSTFAGCTALKAITLPAGIEYIDGAFKGCTALEAVNVTADRPSLIAVLPLESFPASTKIYVPGTAETAYKADAKWQVVKNQIYSADKLYLTDSDNFDIKGAMYGTPVSEIDISTGFHAAQYKAPLKYTAEGLPEGINISTSGKISGTPAKSTPAGTAVITVADSSVPAKTASITINFNQIVNIAVGEKFIHQLNIDATPENFEFEITEMPNGAENGKVKLNKYKGKRATAGALNIPETITLGGKAFDITVIAAKCFQDDYSVSFSNSITSVTIPKTVKILDSAFANSIKLENVTFAEGFNAESLYYTFAATGLKSVIIPSSVTNLEGAFKETKLTSVTIPANATNLKYAFMGCQLLTEVKFAENFNGTNLQDTFYGCEALETITIPESVTAMDSTFSGCQRLKNITIPANVKSLYNTFYGCWALETVTVPAGVENIDCAFYHCIALKQVIMMADRPAIKFDFSTVTFNPNTKIYVPGTGEAEAAYKADAKWQAFVNQIYSAENIYITDSDKFDIKNAIVGEPVSEIDISTGFHALQHKAPLEYTAQGLPEGINISTSGKISGTPSKSAEAGTAVITVKDSSTPSKSASITINYDKIIILQVGVMFNHQLNIGATPENFEFEVKAMPNGTANGKIKLNAYKGNAATAGALNIPETITFGGKAFDITELAPSSFACNAFINYTNSITSVTIPKTVTIMQSAFVTAEKLEKVTFAEGFKAESLYHAFKNTPLKAIIIPDSVTAIDSAFIGTKLTSVTIPANVSNLYAAFKDCSLLTEVKFAEGFQGTALDSTFKNCVKLKSITIPNSVTSMPGTFTNCSDLENVTLSDNVTNLNGAFVSCRSLKTVALPDSVTDLRETFKDCRSLKTMILPDSVSDILGTFSGCTSLQSVKFLAETPKIWANIDDGSFPNITKIYVPGTGEAEAAYKANGYWEKYKNNIYSADKIYLNNLNSYAISGPVLNVSIGNIRICNAFFAYEYTAPLKYTAEGLPEGLTISTDGILSGTPTKIMPAGTAVITVSDSSTPAKTASTTIKYDEITREILVGNGGRYTFTSHGLQAAIDLAVNHNVPIKLTGGDNGSKTLNAIFALTVDGDVEINLNGCEIKPDPDVVGGSLTINPNASLKLTDANNSQEASKISLPVLNNGTINGGRFEGKVENGGVIENGEFTSGATDIAVNSKAAKIKNRNIDSDFVNSGKVLNGRFSNITVTNELNGTILGGSFAANVFNSGTIEHATFDKDYAVTVTEDGKISGGTFNGTVTSNGTISGGTFTKAVENGQKGKIDKGLFTGTTANAGKIAGGVFIGETTNTGEITAGIFTNKPNKVTGIYKGTITNGVAKLVDRNEFYTFADTDIDIEATDADNFIKWKVTDCKEEVAFTSGGKYVQKTAFEMPAADLKLLASSNPEDLNSKEVGFNGDYPFTAEGLKKAVEEAKDNTAIIITGGKNGESKLEIKDIKVSNKNIVIDLSGNSLLDAKNEGKINVEHGASLTIKDTAKNSSAEFGINIENHGTVIVDGAAIGANKTKISNYGRTEFKSGKLGTDANEQVVINNAGGSFVAADGAGFTGKIVSTVTGKVTDSATGYTINNASLKLTDKSGRDISQEITNNNDGTYRALLENGTYKLTVTADGYSNGTAEITVNNAPAVADVIMIKSAAPVDEEAKFWEAVENAIKAQADVRTISINAKDYKNIPESVLAALRAKSGITLAVTWNGGKVFALTSSNAPAAQTGKNSWSLAELEAIANKPVTPETPTTPTTPTAPDTSKENPKTNIGEDQVTITAPSPETEQQPGNMGIVWLLFAVAAAAGGAVLIIKKRKSIGEFFTK